ncbi:hypothetical protein DHT89_04850 [Salmonella enterica]|nr:hypothetical protein [Salmonella enterica]EAV7066489.1 hypothetical protein [Salmonella enterica subsp. arizonae serovar 63:z36:-]EBD1260187.1 hypothetical protein [Salmonella enterica subsp. arizonae serovar 62:z4,z32:-]EBH9979095.1 hypothetical protein [Salmonella enterica subsp. arizonae serovar 40:z36:-]ECJ2546711.1 hypothetical protein [Salmonella enterica subsp. arizonae]EDW1853510.1 hypothetical protein [Salmonella enterica subsp. diarizonae]
MLIGYPFIVIMFILYNAGYTFVKNKCEKRKNNTLLRNSVHFFLGILTIKKFPQKKLWFPQKKLKFPYRKLFP